MRNPLQDHAFKFPLDLGAPAGSLEGRAAPIDNGLDVPDPSRY